MEDLAAITALLLNSGGRSERASEVFSSTTNIRFRLVFPSPFNLYNCTVNCTAENEGIE